MRVFRRSRKISYSKNLNQSCAFKLRTGLNYIYTIGMSIDLVLRAERRAKLLAPEAPEATEATEAPEASAAPEADENNEEKEAE